VKSKSCRITPHRLKAELRSFRSAGIYFFCTSVFISDFILSTVIICAFEVFRKTVLQTVSAAKRFAKSFYGNAVFYDGGQYISEKFPKKVLAFLCCIVKNIIFDRG